MRRRAVYRDHGGMWLRVWCGLVFSFLLAPIVIIVITSFTAGETVAFPPAQYSLRWYAKVLDHLADGILVGKAYKEGVAQNAYFTLSRPY